MPITDPKQIAKIYMIFDVPNKNEAFGALGLVTISGPAGELFTLKDIKTRIDAALAATNTDEDAIITSDTRNILAEFDKVFLQETEVFEDGGTRGILFHADRRMEVLRRRLSNILGVYVPRGGFMAAFERISRRGQGQAGAVGPTR